MIRINLIRNKVQDGATQVGEPGGGGSGGDKSEVRLALVKLFLMLLPMIALYFFEHQNLDQMKSQVAGLRQQMQILEGEAAQKQLEADSVADVEEQAKELEDKMAVIRNLSRLRLREIKTLDLMQSVIPEKVWLKKVEYEADAEDITTGLFNVSGGAGTTEDLSEFVKRLEESRYLNRVIIVKNQELEIGKAGQLVRDFNFRAGVGVAK